MTAKGYVSITGTAEVIDDKELLIKMNAIIGRIYQTGRTFLSL